MAEIRMSDGEHNRIEYEIGDIFIIKIGAKHGTYYQMEGIDWYFPEQMLDKLQKYDDDQLVKSVYAEGANDAWDAAGKIVFSTLVGGYDGDELKEIFGTNEFDCIFSKFPVIEAIDKIKQWEAKQKEKNEIKIGDEVKNQFGNGTKWVVTRIDDGYMLGIDKNGHSHSLVTSHLNIISKTGRHFPEIVELMKKMQETNNKED